MIELEKRILDPSAVDMPLRELAERNPFVTARSRWSSRKWTMDGLTPGYTHFAIRWYAREQPKPLLDELKLVAAFLFLPRAGQPPHLKYSSADHFAFAARFLANFMTSRKYRSLSELDATAFDAFRKAVASGVAAVSATVGPTPDEPKKGSEAAADGDRDEIDEEIERASAARDVEIDRPSYNFVSSRLRIWNWIHWARGDLARAGVRVAETDFFAAKTLPKLAIELCAQGAGEMEDLPDEVVVPILAEAHRLIGEPAEQTIALANEYLALPKTTERWTKAAGDARRAVVDRHPLRIVGGGSSWLAKRDDPEASPGPVVQDAIATIRDACLLVLAAGIGWRISEAASIELEQQEDDELPSCILVTSSHSGTSDHFWIRGKLSKHRPEPTPADWLIGARLSGTGAEPMTVRAVRILERLYRPWRAIAPSPLLQRQLVLSWKAPAPSLRPSLLRRIKADTIRSGMQEFIRDRVGLADRLAPLVGANPRLRPYMEAGGGNIRPHQWRRTFFRMMYRMDDKLLPAISRHFKHISLAVTEDGYAPRSPAAVQELDAAMTSELVALLFERGEGSATPVTGGDVVLARHQAILASVIDGDSLAEATPRLESFAVAHDLRLWPSEHGTCLIALNPDRAACRVRDGRVDWRSDRPDPARRSPGLCCSCPNLIVSTANLRFWRRRYKENRDAWNRSGKDPAFRAARDRAAQAKTIIEQIERRSTSTEPKGNKR